jgi:hypothetical protein
MEEKDKAEIVGDFLGNIFGVVVTLGVIGLILFFCWNYGLHEIAPVDKIKYYQCFLLIIGWRCLTYKQNFSAS